MGQLLLALPWMKRIMRDVRIRGIGKALERNGMKCSAMITALMLVSSLAYAQLIMRDGVPVSYNGVEYVVGPAAELTPTPAPKKTAGTAKGKQRSAKAFGFPHTFKIGASGLAMAWQRAQSFIATYSSMKIQNASDFLIETYNPVGCGDKLCYGYKVVRMPISKRTYQITVSCIGGGGGGSAPLLSLAESFAEVNASFLAYYIATGDLVEPVQ